MKIKVAPGIICLAFILLQMFPAFGQLTGVKAIPGDYSSLSSAVTALNSSGVGPGGVIFNIAADYKETISATISLTATGTAANPITFQKDTATTGANPLISSYSTGVGTPSTAVQDGIWRMIGSDYITIDRIDVIDNAANTTNPSTMEYGYALYKASTSNGCQFVTIKNCVITLNNINNASGTLASLVDGSAGIIVVNALATAATTAIAPVAGGINANNKFYGNTIQNCNIGIALTGYAAAAPFTLGDTNNDIGGSAASTGNIIINFGGAGGATNAAAAIRALAQYGLNISYNNINNNNGSGTNHSNSLRGIYISGATSASSTVTNNTITVNGGGTTQAVTGIENSAGATAAANTINISNNTITNGTYTTATTGGFYGIINTASPATLTINSNTISNNSSAATTTGPFYGVYNTGAASSVTINSNVFSGNSTADLTNGAFIGIYNTASTPALSINNNTLAGNITTSTSGLYYAILNSGNVTGTININSNNIGTTGSPAINFTAANSGAQIFIYNTKGTSAAALSISNNNFYNVLYSTAGTGSNTYISNAAATLSQAINNNTFTNLNVSTSGSIVFISNNVAMSSAGIQNVNNNSISGTFSKAAGNGITLFTSGAKSLSGSIINNNGNNFSNITVTGATTINGWVNTDAGSSTKTIKNNIFSNWVTGTAAATAMNVNITGTNNAITANAINNISGAGPVTGITTGAGNDKIFSNTINTLYTTGTATVTGIAITSGTTKNIYNNKIYDLQANSAGGLVYGISVTGSSSTGVVTANIYNNLIGELRAPISNSADAIRGISITSGRTVSNINVYYNTIYLNAVSIGTNFGTSGIYDAASATATTAQLNLRNNIIANLSTPNGSGYTVAYRRSSASLNNYAATSNNNLFHAGTPGSFRLIYYDYTNSDQLLSTYKNRVSTRDAQSVTEDLITSSKFLSTSGSSPLFLHLDSGKATLAESGASNITSFSIDYDAQTRQGNTSYSGTGTAPDIGADEIQGSQAIGLSGVYNVGAGQIFTSLTNTGGLFAGINNFGLSGNVVVNITSDLTEDASNALYQWAEQGIGNYTLTIQSDSLTMRTISGNALTGLIRLNGAKRVTIDGSSGSTGNYLYFRNTNIVGTTANAFTFINGASYNTIRYCNIEAYTNSTNGVILFSTSTVTGGNSNNTISNCNINATVNSNTGILCIYSAGTATAGFANSTNTISNNNIFNYRDRALEISATGSTAWMISGNSFYNGDISAGINYAAASILYAVRISGGAGYSILNNYIGGNALLASGTSAIYSSTAGLLTYQGISLTTSGAIPVSNIKGNTIANLSVNAVPNNATLILTVFIGIETNGSGINIGGSLAGEGNLVGSNTTNGSIVITTTTTLVTHKSYIRGINCNSSGGLVIGNQVGGIDIKNVGAGPAPSTFYGIAIINAAASPQVNNNIIGSTGTAGASNSIRVLSTSTSTTTLLTGIAIGSSVTATIQVNGNIIQNISYQNTTASGSIIGISNAAITTAVVTITNNIVTGNTNNASTGGFYGIYSNTAPASLSISNNTISNNNSTAVTTGTFYGINTAGAGTSVIAINNNTFSGNTTAGLTTGAFAGIYNTAPLSSLNINGNTFYGNATTSATGVYYSILNSGAVTGYININSNNIGASTLPAITYNAANSTSQYFIYNIAGTSTASLSISNNNFQGILYAVAGTGNNNYITNTAATLSQAINGNIFNNLNVNTSGSITFISNNVVVSSTGTQNVNNNNIAGTFTKRAGGTVTLFTSTAASVAGSVINNNNNNFSNLIVTGATTIAGWVNTDPGNSTKNIQNNTFSNWLGGTSAVTAMSLNLTGVNNTISGNFINNISGAALVTGISSAGNDNIFLNTINTLSTSGSATSVNGITITGGTTKNIYRNKIFDLQATPSVNSNVNGILVSGSTLSNIYNNLIADLRAPAANLATDVIRGISVTSTTVNSTINVYYNTIFLNASSSGTNFSTSGIYHVVSTTATTASLNLRNNSITNISTPKGSGVTAAYRRSGIALNNYATTSNNNLLYAGITGTYRLLYYDVTNSDQTLVTYKSRLSGRDSLSVTENLSTKYLSISGSSSLFLHIDNGQPTIIESGAINIPGFTNDFDAQIRAGNTGYNGVGSAPDIGADEVFGIEIAPPTITYTPLTNTISPINRAVTGINITDASGINNNTATKPRIYFKRFSDANTWLDNTSNTNGWKYTEATNLTSPYNFTIDYTLLNGGATATAGIIQYFIVAQDLATTTNIAINSGTLAAPPSSVSLTAAAFPIGGLINSYNIPFSGIYTVGTDEAFTSLTKADGLFVSINNVGLMGNVIFNVTSDITEDGVNALNQWAETGAGNYTLTIQPDAATARIISGNVPAGLIRLNGADRVTIDGSSGGFGSYLVFKNTNTAGTTGTAFTFLNGATNNRIRYCNAEAYTNAANGVILFGPSSIAGGNSENVVDNCTINVTLAGNVAIYSAGTTGNENIADTISNNTIYGFKDRGLDITATGSSAWMISGNSFYNGDLAATVNYPTSSALQGIRVLGGSGYSI